MRPDSVQLSIAEWIQLSEALNQSAERAGRESREILEGVVEQLAALPQHAKIDKGAVDDVIHDIEQDWCLVDGKIRELIGQATDEIASFVTAQEIRVRSLDRRIAGDRLYNDFRNLDEPIDKNY